jgi:hypothetical protein
MTVFRKVQGLVLWALLSSLLIHAQDRPWPDHYVNKAMANSPVRKGFIVLASGDTLKGLIKVFANNPFYYPVLDTNSNRIQKADLRDIVMMRIYDDSRNATMRIFYDSPPYVDYIKLRGTWNLWRLDGKKKDAAIYDDVLTGSKNHLILVTPKEKIIIYKGGIWYLDDNIDLLLIRFMNQRYKTDVRVQDFTSTKNILFYILDKENARQILPTTNGPS